MIVYRWTPVPRPATHGGHVVMQTLPIPTVEETSQVKRTEKTTVSSISSHDYSTNTEKKQIRFTSVIKLPSNSIPSASNPHVTFISGTCEVQRRTSDLQGIHIHAIKGCGGKDYNDSIIIVIVISH